jgi:hypothetical protein
LGVAQSKPWLVPAKSDDKKPGPLNFIHSFLAFPCQKQQQKYSWHASKNTNLQASDIIRYQKIFMKYHEIGISAKTQQRDPKTRQASGRAS